MEIMLDASQVWWWCQIVWKLVWTVVWKGWKNIGIPIKLPIAALQMQQKGYTRRLYIYIWFPVKDTIFLIDIGTEILILLYENPAHYKRG